MRGDALDAPTIDDSADEQAPELEDCTSDEDGDDCAAAESDEEIVDETSQQSPMKNQTRSKSRFSKVRDA